MSEKSDIFYIVIDYQSLQSTLYILRCNAHSIPMRYHLTLVIRDLTFRQFSLALAYLTLTTLQDRVFLHLLPFPVMLSSAFLFRISDCYQSDLTLVCMGYSDNPSLFEALLITVYMAHLQMLIAAFRSRSCTVPQSLHCQVLSRRFNVSFTAPQTEQVLEEGYPLHKKVILTPFLPAIYTNFLTKSAKPKSLTLRPQRLFIPLRFKSSRRISSYSSVSWCASFQWKSSRWFAIPVIRIHLELQGFHDGQLS